MPAHNTSSNFTDQSFLGLTSSNFTNQSFLDGLITLYKILFISWLVISTCSYMIYCCNNMLDSIHGQQSFKCLVEELWAFVTNDDSWDVKSCKNALLQESYMSLGAIGCECLSLHPFWNITNYYEYLEVVVGWHKWSHKVYCPNIKEFNFNNSMQEHFLLPWYTSTSLTSLTLLNKRVSIFK